MVFLFLVYSLSSLLEEEEEKKKLKDMYMKDPPQRYSHLGVRRTQGAASLLYTSMRAGQQIFEPLVFLVLSSRRHTAADFPAAFESLFIRQFLMYWGPPPAPFSQLLREKE